MPDNSPFQAFELLPGSQGQRLILFCDHARNTLPPSYGDLGLSCKSLQRHIAYDIGAEAVTRRLAALTGAGAALAGFSRLLIDPNRGEDDPTLVMRISDGAIVPGNARIDAAEISRRVETYWRPYRRACAGLIDRARAENVRSRLWSACIVSPLACRALRDLGTWACCGIATTASPRP